MLLTEVMVGGLTGIGELRMIHSLVSWMLAPVERSMSVSAPQMVDHCNFSTSCSAQIQPHLEVLLIYRQSMRQRTAEPCSAA